MKKSGLRVFSLIAVLLGILLFPAAAARAEEISPRVWGYLTVDGTRYEMLDDRWEDVYRKMIIGKKAEIQLLRDGVFQRDLYREASPDTELTVDLNGHKSESITVYSGTLIVKDSCGGGSMTVAVKGDARGILENINSDNTRVDENGSLTIKGGNFSVLLGLGHGTLSMQGGRAETLNARENSDITLDNVVIEKETKEGLLHVYDSAHVVLNKCTLHVKETALTSDQPYELLPAISGTGGSLEINGGKVSSDMPCWINQRLPHTYGEQFTGESFAWSGNGQLVIKGGEFYGLAVTDGTNVKISDAVFHDGLCLHPQAKCSVSNTKIQRGIRDYAVLVSNVGVNSPSEPITLTLAGVTCDGMAVHYDKAVVTVKSGTFTGKDSGKVVEVYLGKLKVKGGRIESINVYKSNSQPSMRNGSLVLSGGEFRSIYFREDSDKNPKAYLASGCSYKGADVIEDIGFIEGYNGYFSVVSGAAQKYTVSFNANGGSAVSKKLQLASGTKYGTLPKTTRTGYTFKGWFTAKSGGSKVTASTVFTSKKNITLYAHWAKKAAAKKYTVSFNANGGSAVSKKLQLASGAKYGTLPKTTRAGYTFKGWFTAKSGGSKVTASTKFTSNKNITLYARWKKTTYKITYVLSGGTLSGKYATTYTVTDAAISLPTPTRKGYTFLDWSTNSKSLKYVAKIKKGSTGNKTFYAFWRKNEKLYYSTAKNGDIYYRPPFNTVDGIDYATGTKHYYVAGAEIPAGEYLVRKEPSSKEGHYEIARRSGGKMKTVMQGTFQTHAIIQLNKGEYINFADSLLIPMAKVTKKLFSTEGLGEFKVGKMIPAGKYTLTATGKNPVYEIHSDARGTVTKSKKFTLTINVTLKKGQYLVLRSDCKISKMPK